MEKKEAEEEGEKKAEEEAEKKAEENQKGGNNENPADKLKNEIITKICKNTTEWKSNDEYKEIIEYRDGSNHKFWAPKIENRKLREVVEYNLLEGPVMSVIYKNILLSFSKLFFLYNIFLHTIYTFLFVCCLFVCLEVGGIYLFTCD